MGIDNVQISQLLTQTVEMGASDLFLSSGAYLYVRAEGELKAISDDVLSPGSTNLVAKQLLTSEQLQALEENYELNIGHVEKNVGRFRINFFKQRGQIAIVARHIKTDIPMPHEIGLPKVMNEQIMAKNGLILVIGATGSGKSTTLASLIDYRGNRELNHIITLEDPIEYTYKHGRSIINQREIGYDTNSWDSAMKNALRQSPDVVVVGEIRNGVAMDHAITFANTGHLCLSTLHATNASQAFERIVNMFPKEQTRQILFDLSHCLRAILCQRLVPSVDGKRRLATECLINTKTVSDLIKQGEFGSLNEILGKSSVKGMHTFDMSLLRLFKTGQISEENALRYADSENDMRLKIQVEAGESRLGKDKPLNLQMNSDDDAFMILSRPPAQEDDA